MNVWWFRNGIDGLEWPTWHFRGNWKTKYHTDAYNLSYRMVWYIRSNNLSIFQPWEVVHTFHEVIFFYTILYNDYEGGLDIFKTNYFRDTVASTISAEGGRRLSRRDRVWGRCLSRRYVHSESQVPFEKINSLTIMCSTRIHQSWKTTEHYANRSRHSHSTHKVTVAYTIQILVV